MSRMITQSLRTINGIDLKTPPLIDPPPRTTIGKPPEKLTVACVWWGTAYPIKYVEILRNSVARHLTIPYEFVCITEHDKVPDGVRKIPTPLSGSHKGWWQKISLFKPGIFGDAERIMYLDLDVIVSGSLDKIGSVQEPFTMIKNFGPNRRHAPYNSSLMVWTPSEKSERIFTKFSPDIMKELHGDQCIIIRVMKNENVWAFPDDWIVSYKYSKLPQWNFIGKETSVFIFHGNPKPDQIKDFPRQHWK